MRTGPRGRAVTSNNEAQRAARKLLAQFNFLLRHLAFHQTNLDVFLYIYVVFSSSEDEAQQPFVAYPRAAHSKKF